MASRVFGILRRLGARIGDHRLDRTMQQPAGLIDLLDQHHQQLLQRPLARRQRARTANAGCRCGSRRDRVR